MTDGPAFSDALIDAVAEAMYLDWFAPARIPWDRQADEMRDKHRKEARSGLAAALAFRDESGVREVYLRGELGQVGWATAQHESTSNGAAYPWRLTPQWSMTIVGCPSFGFGRTTNEK
jgi:hypothetical protein